MSAKWRFKNIPDKVKDYNSGDIAYFKDIIQSKQLDVHFTQSSDPSLIKIQDKSYNLLENQHKIVFVNHDIISHKVTTSTDGHGSITPKTTFVKYNNTKDFYIYPNYYHTPGDLYEIKNITTDCNTESGTLSGNIYTSPPIKNDCNIHVNFQLLGGVRWVRIYAQSNGKIRYQKPNGSFSESANFHQFLIPNTINIVFEAVPNTGYVLHQLLDMNNVVFDDSPIFRDKFEFPFGNNIVLIDHDTLSDDIEFQVTFRNRAV